MREVLRTSSRVTVYRSTDRWTGKAVVVKVLSPAGGSKGKTQGKRFTETVEALKSISLSTVPIITDFGVDASGRAFLAMEQVTGTPLSVCADLPPDRIRRILAQVAGTLERLAHDGVFHHNLDPDNIMVVSGSEGDSVRLLGFGSATYHAAEPPGVADDVGDASDRYQAPETLDPVESGATGDWRADLYSLSMIAVDMLGAEVDDLGSERPTIRFPLSVRAGIVQAEKLEATLSTALARDPRQRNLGWVDLHNALHPGPPETSEYGKTVTVPLDQLEEAGREMEGVHDQPPPRAPSREGSADTEPPEAWHQLYPPPLAAIEPEPPPPAVIDEVSSGQEVPEPPPAEPQPPALQPQSSAPEPPPVPGRRPTPEPPPLPAPTPPEPPSRAVSEPPPHPVVEAVPSSDRRRERRGSGRWMSSRWFVGGAFFVAVVGAVVVGLALRPEPAREPVVELQPTAVPTRAPTPRPVPTEAVEPSINPRLDAAEQAFLDGDVKRARSELAALSPEEIASFTTEEAELHRELLEALESGDRDKAVADLRGGLRAGSIRMLRRGVAGVSGLEDDEIAAEPGLAEDLERARRALQLRTLMFRAHDGDDAGLLLERSIEMAETLPKYSTAIKFRDEAAAALELEAKEAAAAGDFGRAVAALEALHTYWPDREGVEASLAGYRTQHAASLRRQKVNDAYEGVLAAAVRKADAGAPEEGLRLIEAEKMPPGMEERRREVIAGLRTRLSAVDGAAPQIELAPDSGLVYRKNDPAAVECAVTDDYRVVSVVAMLRPEGETDFVAMPMSASEDGRYGLEVSPEVHQNRVVEIYFEARDPSGHVGRLGSPDEPLQLKRSGGLFKRILKKQ